MREYEGNESRICCCQDFSPTDTLHLCQWCRDYGLQNDATFPMIRMSIGLYQIGQIIDWADTKAAYESAAACCIHVIMAAELVRVRMAGYLPRDLMHIPHNKRQDYKKLLQQMTHLTRLHFYRFNAKKGTRRDDMACDDNIGEATRALVISVLGLVSKEFRVEAFENASGMMLQREFRR